MQIFPLSESVSLVLAPSIMRSIDDYLHSATQKIYINLRSPDDRIVTTHLLKLAIRRIPTAKYLYMSQVAHQLAGKLRSTPIEVCQSFPPMVETINPQVELLVWYTELGYVYFQLTARSIVTWLDYIHKHKGAGLKSPLSTQSLPTRTRVKELSLAIYAHGRCCSVLRLARDEQLMAFDAEWEITTPNWLNYAGDRPQNLLEPDRILIFDLPVEHQLIQTLMDVLDGLASDRPQNLAQLALTLAQSWLEFDRHCQIFGDIKRQNPRLAIARCGLSAISRRYLQVLLEDYLGIKAPTEF